MRILKAITKRAQRWIDENVICESYQLVAGGVAGDWRMIDGIAEIMIDEGFNQSRRWWEILKRIDFQVV